MQNYIKILNFILKEITYFRISKDLLFLHFLFVAQSKVCRFYTTKYSDADFLQRGKTMPLLLQQECY